MFLFKKKLDPKSLINSHASVNTRGKILNGKIQTYICIQRRDIILCPTELYFYMKLF